MRTNRDLGIIPGEHIIQVDESLFRLFEHLANASTYDPYIQFEEFLLEANTLFLRVHSSITQQLLRFRRYSNSEGAILIRGLPTDRDLPATPLDSNKSNDKRTWKSEFWLALFSTIFGEPFSYCQEKDGILFQNLCPTNRNRDKLSSESSDILLDFHTEVAFHPYKPDFVFLFCLRQDLEKSAKTLVATIRKIYPLLAQNQKDLLRKPLFETGIDYSFGSPNQKKGGGRTTPIISGSEYDPLFCFDPDLMIGLTKEANALIPILNNLAHSNASYICLEPGDLMIIDNKRSVHARTKFHAKFNGEDRWLQRMLITQDLDKSSNDRDAPSRIINTSF